jgi:hypothetical protein
MAEATELCAECHADIAGTDDGDRLGLGDSPGEEDAGKY